MICCKPRGWWMHIGLLAWLTCGLTALPAAAQEVPSEGPSESKVQFKAGITGWVLGQGETKWNHNSSRLTYKDVGTNVIELTGQATLAKRLFVRANYGFGDIGGGGLIDDDFNAGGPVISRTHSDIKGNDMWYVNGDLGGTVFRFPNQRGSLSVFGGIQYWRQQHRATGVTQVICTDPTFCNAAGTSTNQGQNAITNTATWTSFRMGVESEYYLTRKFSIEGRAAFIPFTHLNNEDVHHLRTTSGGGLLALRQDPSFRMTGNGIGADLEGSVKYMILPRLTATLGYRFWWNHVSDGTVTVYPVGQGASSVRLNEFQTFRHGLTAGLNFTF